MASANERETDPDEQRDASSDPPSDAAEGRQAEPPRYDTSKDGYEGISSGALDDIDDVRAARDFAEMIVDTVREGLLVLDLDLRIEAANESFCQAFAVDPGETVGRLVYDLGNGQWDIPALRELLEDILPHEKVFNDFEVEHYFEGLGRRRMLLNARRLDDHRLILLAMEDVTERRRDGGRAERQLDTFGAALGTFEDFVYVLTPDVRFTYANRALLDLWGLGLDDIVGKGFAELGYPPDLVALHGRQVDEVVATRRTVHGENAYVSPSGHEGYYEYIFSPVLGEGGAVEAIAGITRDVTERRRAANTLRRAAAEATFRARLADALRSLSDPVEVQGAAARVIGEHLNASRSHYAEFEPGSEYAVVVRDYNRGAPNRVGRYRITDFATLDAEARAGRTLVIGDVATDDRLTAEEQAVYEALPVAALVVVPLVSEGRLRAILAVHKSTPHAWTADEVALVEETAERTWEAVERARAEESLAQERARLETVLETLPVGLIIADAKGQIVRVNAATRELWGIPPETTSWEEYGDWVGWWPETGERIRAEEWAMARTLLHGEVTVGELVRNQKFGSEERRYFLNNAAPVRDGEGRITGGVVAMQDVTERVGMEAALKELNEQLEERVEERTQQVREREAKLRELSRALTLAEQRERQRIAHVLHDDLQQVLVGAKFAAATEAERLDAVLDEAIELARSLSHELSPPLLKGEDLGDLLAWVADKKMERYGLTVAVKVEGAASLPDESLRVLLYQLVRELLFNVTKHAGTGRARVTAERADGHVRVVVEDDGAGFDPAELEETGGPGGAAGLGLPSVRERLELVGGAFDVESAPGEGTRVTITVPVGEKAASE